MHFRPEVVPSCGINSQAFHSVNEACSVGIKPSTVPCKYRLLATLAALTPAVSHPRNFTRVSILMYAALNSHLNHELNPNKVNDESAPMHVMQAYLEIWFLPFLNSVRGGCTRVRAPVQWEVVGLHLSEDLNLLPLPRVEPRVFGCTARRLVAVPTGLRSPVPCDQNIKIFRHSKYLQSELLFRGNQRQSEGYARGER